MPIEPTQTSGLLPTQTDTSESAIYKTTSNPKAGSNFIEANSGMNPGEQHTSAGGWTENQPSNTNSSMQAIHHGAVDTLSSYPEMIVNQSVQNVASIAAAQEAARIGYTGPIVGSNGVGIENPLNPSNQTVVGQSIPGTQFSESHINTAIPSYLASTVSGTTVLESDVFSANKTASGTSTITLAQGTNVANIISVFSGSSTSSYQYPQIMTGLSGAGWYQSGTSLVFTNGGYTNFSGAGAASQVPVSGQSVFIDYQYNTTLFNIFSGTDIVTLNNQAVQIIQVYSGNSVASGTYPSSTIGLSGAGWLQNGNNLSFTNGGYMNFNAASVANQIPASGATYWVNYTYITTSGASIAGNGGFTGVDNQLNPVFIPNVGSRFAR